MWMLLICPFLGPGTFYLDPLVLLSEYQNKDASIHHSPRLLPVQWASFKSHTGKKGVLKGLLLVLFLSVGDDVNQVLVVQVPCHIWGEGSEHLLHLTDKKQILSIFITT